jgi:hypothetical protein
MSRAHRVILLCTLMALGAFSPPAAAQAAFGVTDYDLTFTDANGQTVNQAGAHPYAINVYFEFASEASGEGGEVLKEAPRDLIVTQLPGFVGNPTAVPTCSTVDFLTELRLPNGDRISSCPDATAVGVVEVEIGNPIETGSFYGAVHNLAPPPRVASKLGFWIKGVPVTVELGVEETPPNRIVGGPTNISQLVEVLSTTFTLWGVPARKSHDPLRGGCLNPTFGTSFDKCPAKISEKPFLTLPRACVGPLKSFYRATSWRGSEVEGFAETHNSAGVPEGFRGCEKLLFDPELGALPTTSEAESASGLDVQIEVSDEGLTSPDGLAKADIEATEIRLPRGMTVSPSAAEGLGVCSEEQFDAAALFEQGCPNASKLGTLEVTTPILENRVLRGSFYLAEQYENPFGSLLAAYMTVSEPELGIFAKLPARVETDPATGQIVTTVEDIPPFPYSRIGVHLRSGPRAPLITPPSCDADPAKPGDQPYATEAILTPSNGGAPLVTNSHFRIASGPDGSPCPSGLPFSPGFEAGSLNNAAGEYSPFLMRLTRQDGEQDLTRFSATLPPGVVGRIAGAERCPDAALAAAAAKSGRAELASPSCPAASRLGRIVAGAGVGSALTYVPGSLYLSGPYNGAPLSVAAIVPAVAGPFDVGTVLTRVALTLDPLSARVEVDGSRSDPIPHILKGIPLKVRDVRVYADRPQFTLNSTSCDPSQTAARIWGGGADPFSAADDVPIDAASRYQAASCASLGFSPKLGLKLKGGVKRGKFPALRAVYTPKPSEANLKRLALAFPTSAFIEQGHFRTICTRVQFAAGPGHGALCPKGARYGTARVWSPLIDGPLRGPVYLRSSDNNLPDAVFALTGPPSAPIQIEVSVRIDSVKGRLRATVESAPDAPVSRAIVDMQGGQKGLFVNSRHLCHRPGRNRAKANLRGQNGRLSRTNPRVIATTCQQRRKAKRARVSQALIVKRAASRR